MIDGYAFIDSYGQAVPVLDDAVTLEKIVKWRWAGEPSLISDEPRREGEKYNHINPSYAEEEVRNHQGFIIRGWYYPLVPFYGGSVEEESTDVRGLSPYESEYWNAKSDAILNDYAVEIVSAALSAPISREYLSTPYYGHIETEGHERVDVTSWVHKARDGDPSRTFATYERAGMPGIGYKYPPSLIHHNNPNEEWTDYAEDGLYESQFTEFTVHLPNCELGKNTCLRFRIHYTVERVPHVSPRGVVGYYKKYSSTYLIYFGFTFPKKIRRLPMPRFQPRTATDAISCHVMNRSEVVKFIDKLYTKDIFDKLKTTLYGDGAGNILSLKWFYGVRPSLATPQKRKITLGNVILDISTSVFAGEFTQVYMGSVYVGGKFGDYRDYTNMRIQVFVPMVGNVDLEPSMVVGRRLHLLYTINLTDGSGVVTLSTTPGTQELTKTEGWYETDIVVFTTSITYGYEIPLNVESVRSFSLLVGEVATKTVVGGAVGLIAGNVPGAAVGAVAGAASAATSGVQSTYSSGSLAPNSNVMGDFTPKLYRIFNEDVSGDISSAVGRPSGKVVNVGAASGYLKAAMVYGTPSTTMQHTDEIVNMLKEGIFIS